MSWTRVAFSRLRRLFARGRLERELDDEIRFHLAMQVEDNLRAGMDPAEARYAALRGFGGIDPIKESYREQWTFAAVDAAAKDLRYAFRTLVRSRGFSVTCVVTLALAIGANTAMFGVLHAVLLRPLPYRAPERLAMLWTDDPARQIREGRPAYWTFEQWRRESRSFEDMAVFDPVSASSATRDGAERISVGRVSPNFFPLLGLQPLRGRLFSAGEAEQRQRVAIISRHFWQTRFGGSEAAIGATVDIAGDPCRIVGILPNDSYFDSDVWQPHTLFPDWEARRAARGTGSWLVIGRLRPRVSYEQAQAEMSSIARHLDAQLPASGRGRGISLVPLASQVTGPRPRLVLWTLAGAVFCVLLIAATNVANLSIARGAARAREIAIRAALGASYPRIVRQLLAESLALAVAAGLLGLLVAQACIRLISNMQPGNVPRLNEVTLDSRVLACSVAICLLTGLLAGLAPAIILARRTMRGHGPESAATSRSLAVRSARRALVVAQFALAIVLLAGAGLLARSLWSAERVDPGFRPERVLTVQLSVPALAEAAWRTDFYSRALEQIASLPGVESAGIIENLFVNAGPEQMLSAEEAGTASEILRYRSDEIGGDFFEALRTPLLRGRFFSAADGPASPPVALVNNALARRLWPDRDPVGRRFKVGARDSAAPWVTVVGVVGDMRRQGLEHEPVPQVFRPLAQDPPRLATLVVKTTAADPLAMAEPVTAAVRRVDKRVPLYGVTTLEQRLGAYLAGRRFETILLIGFSAAALLMAAIGVYGVVQYSVTMRSREIGVRLAVGARPDEIFRMVLREGLALCIAGLGFGLVGALWLGRAGAGLLFGVAPSDPSTFFAVSLLLLAVAAVACYFPARRATGIDPVIALREQ